MSVWLIIVLIIVVAFIAFTVERIVRVHKKQVTTGKEELIGKTVIVRTPLNPGGQVDMKGEIWEAISESENIESGIPVVITKIDGLKLYVKRK